MISACWLRSLCSRRAGSARFLTGMPNRQPEVAERPETPRNLDCANLAWPIKGGAFAVAGDITVATGSSAANDLTLSAYTEGVRYRPSLYLAGLRPFGQVLVGVAHSSGSLVRTANSNASSAFAANFGGGLDLRAGHRLSFRLIEVDYLLTPFDNGSNNHQNNVRIGAGVVFRF
jgi:hypothetical protein